MLYDAFRNSVEDYFFMKRVLKNVVFLGAALASSLVAAEWNDDIAGIVGVDYKWTSSRGRSNFSGRFPKNYSGASVYLGTRFCENYGLELGYDWAGKKTRTTSSATTVATGTGTLVIPNGLATTVRLSQWRLDLNGYLPIGCDGFDLIGSVGLGIVRSRISEFSPTAVTLGTTTVLAANNIRSNSRTRAIWRLGVGAQYMLTCNVGVRAMYRYEGLSGFNHNGFDGGRGKALRNASAFTLGLLFKF
jgi:opacity protein-like surface antigen